MELSSKDINHINTVLLFLSTRVQNIFIYSLSAFSGSSLELVFFDWNLSLERELILTLLVIKMKHYLDIRLGLILLKILIFKF